MLNILLFTFLLAIVYISMASDNFAASIVSLIGIAFFFLLGDFIIGLLSKIQAKTNEARVALPNHENKKRTPSMGGLIILLFVLIFSNILCDFKSIRSFLFLMVGYFLIGLADDIMKVTKSSKYGLRGKYKLLLESIIAFLFVCLIKLDYGYWISENIRITNEYVINLGWFMIPFSILVILSLANSVNLTDGLDGLVTIPVIFSLTFFVFILYFLERNIIGGHIDYLNLPLDYNLAGLKTKFAQVRNFTGLLIGGCTVFLIFNKKPAKIFMGDCGSLMLGGTLGGLAIFCHVEILMIIVGFIFLIETLSVIIQVISFKTRGKRIFKIAPLHHHYEALGFSEEQIVSKFWIFSFMALIGGMILYHLTSIWFIVTFICVLIWLIMMFYAYF